MPRLKGSTNWLLLYILTACAAVFFYCLTAIPEDEEIIPVYAANYLAKPLSCRCEINNNTEIKFFFTPLENAQSLVPKYSIKEFLGQAKTEVVFYGVTAVAKQFDYNEVIGNPLIDSINYEVKGRNLVVDVWRKGAYLPATIRINGPRITIVLGSGDSDYPVIFDQKPSDNSAIFPALRTLSFKTRLKDPLQKIIVLFNDVPAEFSSTTTEPFVYQLQLKKNIEKDKEYRLKAIVADAKDKTLVAIWMFKGEIPVAGILGANRFQYLGWWGEINTNGINVRKEPNSAFEKVGILSSINRVKVIKEVFGEMIDENNLWYEIDGGKYAHSYIHSQFVTPMIQPEPPKNFSIPEGVNVGEKWIDVDLAKKILTLFNYNKPVFSTYISPGRDENPTETGLYRIWYKLYKAEMRGGPPLHRYRYDLKNIPWVMYYNYDYAIHGTYWHDNFGTTQSAGCTNMTQDDAKFIFDNTKPTIPEEKILIFSSENNPGIVVSNHF